MGNKTLVRHDGSTVTVPEVDADKLLTLGYREQTPTQEMEEGISKGIENFYTSPGQQAKTAIEGGLSGISLGLTDLAFGSDESRERARYNPGLRLGTELIGGLLPLGPGLLGQLGKFTPMGALTRGAEVASEAIGGGKAIQAGTRAAIEGAGIGGGSALTQAQLNGDPITAEAIGAGMGWGALFGGGLGALGGAVEARMEARAARRAVTAESRTEAFIASAKDEFGALRSTLKDATDTLKATSDAAAAASKVDFNPIKTSQMAIKSQLTESYLMKEVKNSFDKSQLSLTKAQYAAKAGKYEEMIEHLDEYKDHMVTMEGKLGGPRFFNAEKVVGQADHVIKAATGSAEELAGMAAIRETLTHFPTKVEEFAALSPKRVEKLTAAIDQLGKLKSAELSGLQESVKTGVAKMTEKLGITMEGPPGVQLQGAWKGMKEAKSSLKNGDNAVMRSMKSAGRYAAGSAMASKLGTPGYIIGSTLASGLMGLKGAIIGTISEQANKWVPRAARATQKFGSRLEPLKTRIDGSEDQGKKDRKELMQARMKEVTDAAPVVRDTLYKNMEPLVREHPELAAQMFNQNVKRFQFILSKLPKDPGLAFSKLKSMWKPDAVATEKFARYYEVFHNPVGVMVRALKTGQITMEAAEGLQEMNPELWQTLRVNMLYRISDPKVSKHMSYADQVHMGMLLGIPLHSSMNPQFIAAQQQMYTERNKPLEMNPRIQPGGGAGRPSGPGPQATSAQRITEH